MRFNMGCGHNRMSDWVNVDSSPVCEPDQVWDLEQTPWPWPDSCATEARFNHSLEHMGGDPKVFLAIMQELYRISADGCVIEIRVPHPRHDNFINDPTHVRIITSQLLKLFDREENDRWKSIGASNTPLAHYTAVDFKVVEHVQVLTPEYMEQLKSGSLDAETIARYSRERLNVVEEIRLKIVARKGSLKD